MINYSLDRSQEQRKSQASQARNTDTTAVLRERRAIIQHKFLRPHPLLKFVNKETVAFLFSISVEQIYRIECWQHVVYVYAEGISRFVSYADFPPVIGAAKPDRKDFNYWRRRWRKHWQSKQAPEFWVKFYTNKFIEAESQQQLWQWGKLIAICKFIFESANIQRLRENYAYQRFLKSK